MFTSNIKKRLVWHNTSVQSPHSFVNTAARHHMFPAFLLQAGVPDQQVGVWHATYGEADYVSPLMINKQLDAFLDTVELISKPDRHSLFSGTCGILSQKRTGPSRENVELTCRPRGLALCHPTVWHTWYDVDRLWQHWWRSMTTLINVQHAALPCSIIVQHYWAASSCNCRAIDIHH